MSCFHTKALLRRQERKFSSQKFLPEGGRSAATAVRAWLCATRPSELLIRPGPGIANALVLEDASGSSDGSIDVPDRAIARSSGNGVIFATRDISACLTQVLKRFVNAAAMIWAFIDCGVIGEIPTVIGRGVLDLVDGRVDPAYRLGLIGTLLPVPGAVLNKPTCRAQIR